MSALAVALAAVEIGTPLRRGPFALYPLFGGAPPAPPYRADVAASSLLRVTELDNGAEVNALQVEAVGDVPLLLLAGELLLGNLQDRAVDVPVLVPAGRSVQVPVSCVEQGRWGDGRPSDRVGRVTPPAARARNLGAVARNVEQDGIVAGDQGMVWEAVEEYATRFSAEAPTRSLADVHRAMGPTALEGSSPLQGQRGVVATVGDCILGVDLFDRPDVLQAKWDAIVAGYALDAARSLRVSAGGTCAPSSARSPGFRCRQLPVSASAPRTTWQTSRQRPWPWSGRARSCIWPPARGRMQAAAAGSDPERRPSLSYPLRMMDLRSEIDPEGPVKAVQWGRLVTVMAMVAKGDRAAVVMLYLEFGRPLSGIVRRHLARFGVSGIHREELDGLVLDACFAIADCAAGWDASTGVAPWTWADRRIAGVVSSHVGQHADGLNESVLGMPAPADQSSREPAPLEALSSGDPMCRLLKAAFVDAGVSTRDQNLLIETRLQASLGDPAPASTVAPMYGMTPCAVRQAVKRSKDRLRRLSKADASYAALADLALLA